jgi:tetratricopeptide (TPR) repeat protein
MRQSGFNAFKLALPLRKRFEGTMGKRFLWPVFLLMCSITGTRLVAQGSNWPEIQRRYKLAMEALQSGQDSVAEKEFREILRLDPKNASACANLGMIAFRHGDYTHASTEFRTAINFQPSLWNAVAFLGMSELRLGNNDEAKPWLESAFEHVRDPDLRTQVSMDLITLYHASNQPTRAVDVLRAVGQAASDDPATLYLAYRTYSDLAAQQLSRLAQVAPESTQMHQILAQALASQDDFQGAIAQYRRALELDPQLPGGHFEIGQLALQESTAEPARQIAEKEFRTALSADPKNAECLYMLGEIQWLRSQPQEAFAFYKQALALRPAFVDAHIAVGKALTTLGQTNAAVQELLEAVRLDPQSEVAHYRLSEVYRRLGRMQDAERELAAFRELRDSHAPLRALYQQIQEGSVRQQTVGPNEPQ